MILICIECLEEFEENDLDCCPKCGGPVLPTQDSIPVAGTIEIENGIQMQIGSIDNEFRKESDV